MKYKYHPTHKPVLADGEFFTHQEAAARAHSISFGTVNKRIANPRWPGWSRFSGRVFVIEEHMYQSISEAARKLGISRTTVRSRIASEKNPEYKVIEYGGSRDE